jgi:hypothetical protein
VLVFEQRHIYAFIMWLTVEELVFILKSYLKGCLTLTVGKVSFKNLEGKRQ